MAGLNIPGNPGKSCLLFRNWLWLGLFWLCFYFTQTTNIRVLSCCQRAYIKLPILILALFCIFYTKSTPRFCRHKSTGAQVHKVKKVIPKGFHNFDFCILIFNFLFSCILCSAVIIGFVLHNLLSSGVVSIESCVINAIRNTIYAIQFTFLSILPNLH